MQGNRFGATGPPESTPNRLTTDIEITDSTEGGGFKAENNEIGGGPQRDGPGDRRL